MERKVNKLEHSHTEVIVKVDEALWVEAQKKAFKKLAANVSVPGFRKGKAPEHMLKGRIDPMKVMDEAINSILPTVYRDVLANEDVRPMMQPAVDVTKLSDKELEVKFTIVSMPEVVLGEYKGLKLGKEAVEVTEADIDNAVNALVKSNATLVVKEEAAEMGDTVVIDFVGSVDGVPFDGGAAEGHELELGSGSFIPGFEDQCVGLKAGDKKDINVKFPENYTAELKGKDAVFAIKCHEVKAKKLPELTDEFVKDLGMKDVENIAQLRDRKKADLQNQKTAEARRVYMNKLLEEIAKNSTIDMPEEIIEKQADDRKMDMAKRMEQSGLTLEQYLQIVGQSEEDFMNQMRNDSRKDFTNFLVLNAVGKAEKIVITDEELDAELQNLAAQYNMKLEDVKKALNNKLDEYRSNLGMQRVEDLLFANND